MVLIFDEVITGFRYSPGGAQQVYGVTPDLTTLAKIVAGGLPGGAVVGKREILRGADVQGRAAQGSLRARAAAGDVQRQPAVGGGWGGGAADRGRGLGDRAVRIGAASSCALGCADVLERRGVAGAVLGESSVFQILLGEGMEEAVATTDVQRLMAGRGAVNTLRKAMLLNGVDLMRSGGFTSIVPRGRERLSTRSARSTSRSRRSSAKDWPEERTLR